MSFPLADWVLDHPDVRHNLALSGLKGSLRSLPRALRDRPEPDPPALRAGIARLHGVPPSRVFLTHGATEANALVLLHLAREAARRGDDRPTLHVPVPEYPPLGDAGVAVGFRRVVTADGAGASILASPRNPEGTLVPEAELRALASEGRTLVVDQTFREFTEAPAVARLGLPNLWTTGSFTKIYGADEQRLGYAIPPEPGVEGFAVLHGLLLDRIPAASVSGGLAILRHRRELLAEARALFRANVRALGERVDGIPDLAAPVWFDRTPAGLDTDAFQQRLLKRGILVCGGRFFGDPGGVRLALTRRSFPEDLDAYLGLRPSR